MSNVQWSEWIQWSGGECPIPEAGNHQVKFRDGSVSELDDAPKTWIWDHKMERGDIVAYRYELQAGTSVSEPDEEPGLNEAFARMSEAINKPKPRKADTFLLDAVNLLTERGKEYDQAGGDRSMGKAVNALNAITGRDLTEAEGWLLMSLVKRVRQYSTAGYHKDSAEDAVAYGALEAEALEAGRG